MKSKGKLSWKKIVNSSQLYLMFFLPLVWFLVFCYGPMYGVLIAFKDYQISKGILGSPWVGFANFSKFFSDFRFASLLVNTLRISVYNLLVGMPFAILLALALHNCDSKRLKSIFQTITYAPHFISTVVIVGMLIQFLHPRFGAINAVMKSMGMRTISFMSQPTYFVHIYVWSDVWQHAGWGSIIYLSALSSVDISLYDAAMVDGASRFQRTLHIDLPSIMPTIVITAILNVGGLLDVGFEKVYLMQNNLNLSQSEIISTYLYKMGVASTLPNYSYGTAIGLFNSLIGLILIVGVNWLSRKTTDANLW